MHRSVAIGLAILYMITESEKKSIEIFYKQRPFGFPNKKLIGLIDKLLGSDFKKYTGSMVKRLTDYLDGKIEINKDDYLDELPSVE